MANAGLILATLVTFNGWGLPDVGFKVLSPLRTERFQAVCETLKKKAVGTDGWDVVLLQEIWVPSDRRAFRRCGYDHVVDLDSPTLALDSGLLILSRHRIEQTARLTYPAIPFTPGLKQDGEAFAKKSAYLARVVPEKGNPYWVADTHLVSDYSTKKTKDGYFEIRRQQFLSFARWALAKAGKEPLLVGGDWNFDRPSPLWEEIAKALPGFTEAREGAAACTLCPPNTQHSDDEGKVDHLFGSPQVTSSRGTIVFDDTLAIDDATISVSDHFGWSTEFRHVTAP